MAHKKQRKAPIPAGNRQRGGPSAPAVNKAGEQQAPPAATSGTGFQEQDVKRRLGDYGGAGEHPYVQPGGKNDANR